MLNYKNKNKNKNITKYTLLGLLIFFLIILLPFVYYTINNNQIIEGIQFYSNEFNNEYKALNITYDKTNKKLIRKYPGQIKIIDCKNINPKNSTKITSNKYYTSDLLNKNRLPVPKFMLYNTNHNNHNNHNNILQHNLKYPLVIKPLSGSGGKDITMDNNNIQDLQKNINKLNSYDKLLIEEQQFGNDYRILIYNNEVIDVILRNKPSLIGNGIDNISELISKYNTNLRHRNFAITKVDTKVLKEQNKNLQSIPTNGERIIINKVCGDGEKLNRIPLNAVHKDNIDLSLQAVNITNTKLAGIDFISKDISVSWKNNDAKIIEINSSPCLLIHKYAIDDTKQNIPYKFFTKLFEPFINL